MSAGRTVSARFRASGLGVAALCVALAASGCQTTDVTGSVSRTDLLAGTGAAGESDLDMGTAHYVSGNYGLAEKHFRKATELDPADGDAWLGLAASYDRLGRFDFADRAYDQLVKVAGRTPRVINNLGYSQFLRGNREKARKLFVEARAALPDDPVVRANLALVN